MTSGELDEGRLRRLIAVGRALVSEFDLDTILEQVLEVAREVTGAQYAALGVLDSSGGELERFLVSGIEAEVRERIGDLPRGRGVLGVLISDPHPLRLEEVSEHPRSHGFPPEHPPMHTFLGVPVLIRDKAFGNLYLTEKEGGAPFDESDEQSVTVLAEWAAIAIENARSVAADRLRDSMASSELERGRWSRELHDETLQALGALRVLLASALRSGDQEQMTKALSDAVGQLGTAIDELRSLITELRPAALEDLGLEAALEDLARRSATRDGINVQTVVVPLAPELEAAQGRLARELEDTIYRVTQEALTNVARHARAESAVIRMLETENTIELTIEDDGVGFDSQATPAGFGLKGIRERVELADGRIEIDAAPGSGTRLTAVFPIRRSDPKDSEQPPTP
jgi:signal transduction histidine kinase